MRFKNCTLQQKKEEEKKYNYIAFTPLEINLEQMNFIYRL